MLGRLLATGAFLQMLASVKATMTRSSSYKPCKIHVKQNMIGVCTNIDGLARSIIHKNQ